MKQEEQEQEPYETKAENTRFLREYKPMMIVVTGIMGSGKSTVGRLLAQRFSRGVYIEADVLQQMIVSGGVWVGQPGEPEREAARQLDLRLKNLCLLGRSFFEAGFTVVLDDIIMGERWQQLQAMLHDISFSLIVLAPHVEVVSSQRDRTRAKAPQGHDWAVYLDEVLRLTMSDKGFWIDTSEQTPEETVEVILQHLEKEEGRH